MTQVFLSESDLAGRWHTTAASITKERIAGLHDGLFWKRTDTAPVLYRIAEVEKFEKKGGAK